MSEELKKQEELGHRHGEGCGCQNDHHGEEAGRRGHDHHHGETGECHEHHHGEAGECHDRHHGEECGCHDQDHEHEHHHHHESDEIPSVSVYTQDIAVVGSVKCRIDGEYEDALDKLQGCMEEAARAVEAAGGMIGHVKAFAKEEARSCMISITDGEDIQRKPSVGNGICVENANIVFGVTPARLEEILKGAFKAYLK